MALSVVFFWPIEGSPMTEHHQPSADSRRVERAIVLQLLRDDHGGQWSVAELETELGDFVPLALNDAIAHLERQGVAMVEGEDVQASPAVRRLDELGLVGV